MFLRQIFDPQLAQYSYLLGCQKSKEALIVDPERDVDRYIRIASENNLRITSVAETHIHADFVSGARELAVDSKIHLYLSAEGGEDWQYAWPRERANTHFVKDKEIFFIGNIKIQVIHTPGHTPEHICFLVTDLGGNATEPLALLSGDFLFVGDVGRPDLLESAAGFKNVMEPSARTLRKSICQSFSALGDYVQVLPAHGAGSVCGKSLGAVPTTTVGYERRFNLPIKLALADEEAFVKDILQGQPEPPLYFARMKQVNRDGISVTGELAIPKELSSTEFSAAALKQGVVILDCRHDRIQFDNAHFPKAIYAPLKAPLFSVAAGSYVDPKSEILLLLEKAADIEPAVRQLYRIGYDFISGFITIAEAKQNGLLSAKIEREEFNTFDPKQASESGLILDVRNSSEYAHAHLKDAISLPYTKLKLRLDELPKNKCLYVHCAGGQRAALSTSFLSSQGYKVVHVDGAFESCSAVSCQRT